MSFLTIVFASNAAIYQPQSDQVKWLKKMRENGERSYTVSYIQSISMAGKQTSKLLEKALFVDIRVAVDLLQSGLFASNAQELGSMPL